MFVQVDIDLLKDLVLERSLFSLVESTSTPKKWSVDHHHPRQQLQEEIVATMLNIRRAWLNLPSEKVVGQKHVLVEFDPKVGKYRRRGRVHKVKVPDFRQVFKPKQRFSYQLWIEILEEV